MTVASVHPPRGQGRTKGMAGDSHREPSIFTALARRIPLGRLPRLGALAYASAWLTLTVWTVLPVAIGWEAVVVTSGSMAPAVAVGDAVVVQPVPAAEVRVGDIVVFDDPARPGGLLTHRVVDRLADGGLVTRGDANAAADPVPVAAESVHGRARLVVPYVGRFRPGAGSGWTGTLMLAGSLGTATLLLRRRSR